MQNVGIRVKYLADAVSAKIPHGGVAEGGHVILDHAADFLVIDTGFHDLTRRDPAIVRGLQQLLGVFVDLPSDEHLAAVAVVSVQVHGDVEVDDITILQPSIIGDSVTDHLVNARAAAFGEPVIIERRWVGAALYYYYYFKIVQRKT